MSQELLTVREVAALLRVDPTTVTRWIKKGALVAVYCPGEGERHTYRIRKTVIDALLNQKEKSQEILEEAGAYESTSHQAESRQSGL